MKKSLLILGIIGTFFFSGCYKTTVIENGNNVNGTLSVDSTSLTLNGIITSVDSFTVTTNLTGNITISPSGASWLSVNSYPQNGGNKIIVTASASNNTDTVRTAIITVTTFGDTALKPVNITVSQKPYIINNPNALNCDSSPYRLGTTVIFSLASGGVSSETFTKDTIINGITYFGTKIPTGDGRLYVYYAVDSLGNNWELLPQIDDYPASNMVYNKQNQAVGTSWTDTFPSISQPATVSYVYTHQVLQTGLTFNIGGATYTNGTQVQETLSSVQGGVSTLISTTTRTFQCGLGVVQTIEYGSVYSTLAGYTY
jgi:hypothetical protein